MKGQRRVRLVQLVWRKKGERPEKSQADTVSWEGVDRDLFEALRQLRRQLAQERSWQPYMIFSDATLRELARVRPSSLERMRLVFGIGGRCMMELGSYRIQAVFAFLAEVSKKWYFQRRRQVLQKAESR
jgi:ATP-dependent DNA helicase RecQ